MTDVALFQRNDDRLRSSSNWPGHWLERVSTHGDGT